MPPDSALNIGGKNNAAHSPDPADLEKETQRQIIANLLSSKEEINKLRNEVSDSLAKSGLSEERRSLFRKTIRDLEESSDIANRQLQQILVSDLQTNRDKLNDITTKMKRSEKELGTMIQRLDKITGYMQLATTLLQSLLPIPSAVTPAKPVKESK
jgi:chromosome segregation ATPase